MNYITSTESSRSKYESFPISFKMCTWWYSWKFKLY